MESQSDQSPLVVIVGETASGKSALALDLAQRFDGEIIAADSRTIYKGMDIGTAKPDQRERLLVPHHLLDVVSPDQPFTAADFKARAQAVIADITRRGKLPLLVGGTGLYIDAVLYNFSFAAAPDLGERQRLQQLTVAELQAELVGRGIPLPVNDRNPRHLIRQLETAGSVGQRSVLRRRTLILGLQPDREYLNERIHLRVNSMFVAGLEQEIKELIVRYGWQCPALRTIGYQEFKPFFEGKTDLSAVKAEIEKNSRQLAKRQRTWFKRNKSIHWISQKDEAVDLVTTFLNK